MTEIALREERPSELATFAGVLALAETEDPYVVYLAQLKSAESRRTMQGCLDRIAAMLLGSPAERVSGRGCQWGSLRYEHAMMIRAMLGERGWSPSHVNKHLSALKGVLRQAWLLGQMSAEDFMRIKEIEGDDGERLPTGRSIHADEHTAIEAACQDGTLKGLRDYALVAVLRSTGLRRHEAAKALIEDYDPAERVLRVIGKRDKQREVYVYPTAAEALGRWLNRLDRKRGPIFRPIDRYGRIGEQALSPRAVGWIVSERRRQAGVAPMATHDYRRSLGGDMLDSGADLVQVQRLFGHADASTTAGYDRRPGRALRAAVDRLDPNRE